MQGPTGSAGVQARPNRGQSCGAHTPRSTAPRSTAPHRQPGFSASGPGAKPNFLAASQGAKASRRARPLAGISPRPRHTLETGSNTRAMAACAAGLPASRTRRVYSFSRAERPSACIWASRQTE